jgi:hypothetical protein
MAGRFLLIGGGRKQGIADIFLLLGGYNGWLMGK